jgi:hypothetical protein
MTTSQCRPYPFWAVRSSHLRRLPFQYHLRLEINGIRGASIPTTTWPDPDNRFTKIDSIGFSAGKPARFDQGAGIVDDGIAAVSTDLDVDSNKLNHHFIILQVCIVLKLTFNFSFNTKRSANIFTDKYLSTL